MLEKRINRGLKAKLASSYFKKKYKFTEPCMDCLIGIPLWSTSMAAEK